MDHFQLRDHLLNAAVDYTNGMTGKKRDLALFDYLCGACKALAVTGTEQTDLPPWLFILAVRSGDRLKEIERMLHGAETPKKEYFDGMATSTAEVKK